MVRQNMTSNLSTMFLTIIIQGLQYLQEIFYILHYTFSLFSLNFQVQNILMSADKNGCEASSVADPDL